MEENYQSAGIIIVARDTNRFLMLHRVNYPVTWSALAGGIEKGEDPIQTIKREINEEIGINPMMIDGIEIVGTSKAMGHLHYVIVGFVDTEFKVPNLKKDENDKYGWFDEESLPSPLHPGFRNSLKMIEPLLTLREHLKIGLNMLLENNEFDWVGGPDLNDPKIWLANKFFECKLEKIGHKNWVGWTRYVDPEGKILFLDNIESDEKIKILYFDYGEIYSKLAEMGLNYKEMQQLCKEILYEVHKRKVDTAYETARMSGVPIV